MLVTIGNSLISLRNKIMNFQLTFVNCCYGLSVFVPPNSYVIVLNFLCNSI